jgi:hypothetical protein
VGFVSKAISPSRGRWCVGDQERDAGPPWQEVVPLRCPGQAVVQAVAKDTDDVAGLGIARVHSSMTDMPETFETFLRSWIAENVDSLGSQTDATNLKYILRVRADELEKAATIKGFYGELAEAARPYGGIEGYVQHQFEEARRG